MNQAATRRIVFLTSNFPPMTGGVAHHLYEIARHMPRRQTLVLGLPTPSFEAFDSQQDFAISRLRLPRRWHSASPAFKFLAPAYAQQLLTVRGVDMVLCGQAHHTLMLPAWVLRRLSGVPYGVFVYGLDLLRPLSRRHRGFFMALLTNAKVVFADSVRAAEIAANIGIGQDRIRVVHPTVDPARMTNSRISAETVRKRHGLDGKRVILTVGRLVERKGHDTVLRALPQILQAVPEAHYVIAGTGPNEPVLKSLVARLGLEDHVTFAGHVPDAELPAYYEASELFVMISREIPETGDMEGFGIVYIEAGLLGKPVVGGRSGGVADAVLHEETGLLVDPHEPAEAANAIVRLLSDATLACRLGENGRMRALTDFSPRSAAEKVLSALPEGSL